MPFPLNQLSQHVYTSTFPPPLIFDRTFPKVIVNITCSYNQGIINIFLTACTGETGQQITDTCPCKGVNVWLENLPALKLSRRRYFCTRISRRSLCVIELCACVSCQFTFYFVFLFKKSASFSEFSNTLPANISAFYQQL